MKLTSWGRYPIISTKKIKPYHFEAIPHSLKKTQSPTIARGLGRSYGDSALSDQILDITALNQLINFDSKTGVLECQAGIGFDQLLEIFVPKGWFLPVTPGTKFVTVGGAIASDVHGKNHHKEGSFCDFVSKITLWTPKEGVITCGPDQNRDLFLATCGGMGLTGVILSAQFKLIPIQSSSIDQIILKASSIDEAFAIFDQHLSTTYSVAWIDCLKTGKNMGRSLVMLGEHAKEGKLEPGKPASLKVPFVTPGWFLNRFSIQAFNTLYFHKNLRQKKANQIHYEPFFYPLDGIQNWNRMYGRRGFTQYQFALPKEASLVGMKKILKEISQSKKGSFLAVLKAFGRGNANYLSFPIEGYTLALDFKIDNDLFKLLDRLDRMVLDYGGRVYLTKDVRMSEQTFKESYPQWEQFVLVRKNYGADQFFHSHQSQRLKI